MDKPSLVGEAQVVVSHADYREFLRAVYQRRAVRNRLYSMRAFARDLRISPQMLSNVFKGRRNPSPSLVKSIAEVLSLAGDERAEFYRLYIETVSAEEGRTENRPA